MRIKKDMGKGESISLPDGSELTLTFKVGRAL
jgi:hypothetical protein